VSLSRLARAALLLSAAAAVLAQEPGSAPPIVRFLTPSSLDLPFGETRIEVEVSGSLAGDEMDFFVDGRKVGNVAKPPWQVVWQAGEAVRRHVITVALLRGGREIATARLQTREVGFISAVSAHAVGVAPIVTDGSGHYVQGLSQKDFTVLDDGETQKIETFDAADSPLAAILVLDISASMLPKLDEARRAAHTFLQALKPEDEVGLFTFNSAIVGSVDLTRNRATLHSAIDEARPDGETALYDVTASALRRLKSLKRRKAVVLFTDGEDNRSRLSVNQVIEMARTSEVSIFSVAQGVEESKTLMVFLNRLAEETGGRSFFIGNIKKLPEVFRAILAELKSQYFLTYTPASLKPRSWHQVQVRVNRPDVVVRAKKEYFVE
jgi:Ca-activated chloride channel family protein